MESNRYSDAEHVPACSTWPPAWLSASTPPRPEAKPTAATGERRGGSLLDLPSDLFETWRERACIMHFDGDVPLPEAEAEALADVLRQGKRVAEGTGAPTPRAADRPTATVQATLFPLARGPYG
jgi:hypothetical protein